MWTAKNRGRYDRSKLRYPSDLTDDEWAHVEPLIPPAKRGGNKRHVEVREVMNGIMYILSTGCQWRAIPKDLPPRSTLFDYLDLWSYDGTLDRIHHVLYVACREQGEREASPTAAMVDSQSVKSAEKGGAASIRMAMTRAKRSRGRSAISRRHAGFAAARHHSSCRYPRSRWRHLFADGGYQGPDFQKALAKILPQLETEIVKRSDRTKGFVVLPRRWVVERTFAWLNRCRRLAKDWENLNRNALAFLRLASIRLMLRKLCNPA